MISGIMPVLASRSCVAGTWIALIVSALSLSMIERGVCAGASIPIQIGKSASR